MPTLHFDLALTPGGWLPDVRVDIAEGLVAGLGRGRPPGSEHHAIGLPGMPNVHSHAFQRAMAGLAEARGAGSDTFWTWREAMYRCALRMDPDDVEAVASQLYVEMLEAGFTRVGEFHYLHHGRDGAPYADRAETGAHIAAAAAASGISLTLLPVLYRHGGFGGLPAGADQRRFTSTLDGYAELLAASRRALEGLPGANIGVAPHSLRAVAPADLRAVALLAAGGPVHVHVAEQEREVADCLAWCGARPVELLLHEAPVDEGWCLVHATHMSDAEARGVASRGAVVGLCPITEANLGDGTFDAPRFLGAGGRFGVGTDSNVAVEAAGELRQLEYSQRLARRERNVIPAAGEAAGRALFTRALSGGMKALGQEVAGLAPGAPADIVSLRADHPALAGHGPATLLDAWIFCAGNAAVDCVWTRGVKRVEDGRHVARGAVARRFRSALAKLAS